MNDSNPQDDLASPRGRARTRWGFLPEARGPLKFRTHPLNG